MPPLIWRNTPAHALHASADLQADWNRLNAARLDLPFLSAEAIRAALDVFGDGSERLLVATGVDRAAVLAMLLLVPDGRLRWRTFQPSQVPLGAWVAAVGLAVDDLGRSLLRGPLGFCLAVSLTQLDPLQAPRTDDDADNRHGDYVDTAWIDVVGSFDDYWAARGKNLRQNMRKQRNKLAADGTATALRVWRDVGEMAPAIARYGALEAAGWKAGEGTAIHPDNAQGRYYTRLLEDAARQGQAVVFEYLFGERTAAINLCLLRAGTLVVLKTTYDESIPKSLSPAFLLREEELRLIFGGGFNGIVVRRIEYYGRVMDWHTKLTEQRRMLYHLTTYRWPLLKTLAERRRGAAAPTVAAQADDAQVAAGTA